MNQRGFTLLELVVAVGIFGLMSVMAYGGLSSALNTRDHTEAQAERLAELQKAFAIISRDVEQAVNRSVHNNYADELPPMSGGGYGATVLELSRNGRRNPMAQTRSNIQRVDYLLDDAGSLLRQNWLALDRAIDSEPFEAVLLKGVKAIDLRFMDQDHQWQTQWPTAIALANQQPAELPRAVEVSIDLEDWGRITRLFEVVG